MSAIQPLSAADFDRVRKAVEYQAENFNTIILKSSEVQAMVAEIEAGRADAGRVRGIVWNAIVRARENPHKTASEFADEAVATLRAQSAAQPAAERGGPQKDLIDQHADQEAAWAKAHGMPRMAAERAVIDAAMAWWRGTPFRTEVHELPLITACEALERARCASPAGDGAEG